jgi:hypothetical protein
MDQKGQTDLLTVLVGGLFGAATGALMSLWVNVWAASHRRSKLNKELRFEPRERSGHRVAARVHNGYKFPLSHVYAYITIKHDSSDVLDHPQAIRLISNRAIISLRRIGSAGPLPEIPLTSTYMPERNSPWMS